MTMQSSASRWTSIRAGIITLSALFAVPVAVRGEDRSATERGANSGHEQLTVTHAERNWIYLREHSERRHVRLLPHHHTAAAQRSHTHYEVRRALPSAKAGREFVPPRFQAHPQPQPSIPNIPVHMRRSRLTLPVPLPSPSDAELADSDTSSSSSETSGSSISSGSTMSSAAPIQPAPATPNLYTRPEYASRIPGLPGYVHPPGMEEDEEDKYMLDVRLFMAGQRAKDPRTGEIFLVPPKR